MRWSTTQKPSSLSSESARELSPLHTIVVLLSLPPTPTKPSFLYVGIHRRASAGAKFTWSVCTGAWILAKAGLLDGRNATANKFYWDYTSVYGPNVNWKSSARWVVDGKYWTSSGVSAGRRGLKTHIRIE